MERLWLNRTDSSSGSVQGQRYSSSGTALGAEFQVNTYTTNSQGRPEVSPDGAGGFVVVWPSNGSAGTDSSSLSVQGQRYSSSGATLGAQFQINTYTTSFQFDSEVSPDGAGGFVVVWSSYALAGTDSSSYSIQGQRYSSSGAALGAEFQVNTYTTDSQSVPEVSPDGAGGFVVVWSSYGSAGTDSSQQSVQGQRFGPGPTETATPSPTASPTATPTATPSATASVTPTRTPSVTATPSSIPTSTATRTPTPSSTATPSSTPTQTRTPSSTPTLTRTPSPSVTATASPTATPSATATGTPSLTPTVTPSATPSATSTATATPGPLCSRADGGFLFELLEADFSAPGSAAFSWRLTSSGATALTRVDFRFVPGAAVTSPAEGSTYTSASGRTYLVDVVAGGPNRGVGFVAQGNPIAGGQSDTFDFTVDRAGLSGSTVLGNNASAGAATGRMDLRSSLCYALPASGATKLLPSGGVAAGLALAAALTLLALLRRRRV